MPHCGQTRGLSKQLEDEIKKLFELYDKSPKQALFHLQRENIRPCLKRLGISREEVYRLGIQDMQRMKKKFLPQARSQDIGLLNNLRTANEDSILFYETEQGSDQPVAIGIMTPTQKQVLRACHRLILVHGCHAIDFGVGNKLLAMLLRDPFGHGYPVAFCISCSETAEDWTRFFQRVFQWAQINARDITEMIDKPTSCISALEGLNIQYVLCIFHVMQAWGRHLKSVGGIWRTPTFWAILNSFRRVILAPHLDQARQLEEEFKTFLRDLHSSRQNLNLLEYYTRNWETYEHQIWRCTE